jgi:hypothetical protein
MESSVFFETLSRKVVLFGTTILDGLCRNVFSSLFKFACSGFVSEFEWQENKAALITAKGSFIEDGLYVPQ